MGRSKKSGTIQRLVHPLGQTLNTKQRSGSTNVNANSYVPDDIDVFHTLTFPNNSQRDPLNHSSNSPPHRSIYDTTRNSLTKTLPRWKRERLIILTVQGCCHHETPESTFPSRKNRSIVREALEHLGIKESTASAIGCKTYAQDSEVSYHQKKK